MTKFVYETELNLEIEILIEHADQRLIIISPYIKLHERIKDFLREKIENHKLEITIVYGKNIENKQKSLSEEDYSFLKQFPNIQIRYEKRLHAKFYANEKTQILSTMNLYDYSQDKNIEAGIVTEYSYLKNIASQILTESPSLAQAQLGYFEKVIEKSELIFENTPMFERGILGLTKKYAGSEATENKTTPNKISNIGYCIRTGVQIPFNLKRPYTDKAFESWCEYKNKQYKEKYCHFSGEASNGETTYERPILSKNWTKAKTQHHF